MPQLSPRCLRSQPLALHSQSQSQSMASQGVSGTRDAPAPEEVDLFRKGGEAEVLRVVENPAQSQACQAEPVLLDSSRSSVEDDELCPSDVLLHVYDLTEGFQRANKVLAFSSDTVAVGGIFHVGVEAFGSEWSYGCYGVRGAAPRTQTGHVYHCSICLGPTELDRPAFAEVLYQMCREWRGADYQLLSRNCCSFASDLIDRLGVGPIPPFVNRFVRLLDAGHQAGHHAIVAGRKTSRVVRKEALEVSRVAVQGAIAVSKVAGKATVSAVSGLWEQVVDGIHGHARNVSVTTIASSCDGEDSDSDHGSCCQPEDQAGGRLPASAHTSPATRPAGAARIQWVAQPADAPTIFQGGAGSPSRVSRPSHISLPAPRARYACPKPGVGTALLQRRQVRLIKDLGSPAKVAGCRKGSATYCRPAHGPLP